MFRSTRIMLVLVLLLGLSGCSQDSPGSLPVENERSGFPITLQDDLGRQVTIDKAPQHIVSLSPSNTEILFAIGLDSRVAGVTTYCNYPAAANQCRKVGGFSDPNLEMIIALNPDLVVAESIHSLLIPTLEEAGIPVLAVEPQRLVDISGAVEVIGQATGKQVEANRLAEAIRDKTEQVRSEIIEDSDLPLVYYEVWHEPLMTTGPNTLIDDLITVCGGINLAGDAVGHYPEISEEAIILRNPEVIVYQESHGEETFNPMNRTGAWQTVKAVQSGRVMAVNPDIVNRAGPRVIQAMDELLRIIHPELELRGD